MPFRSASKISVEQNDEVWDLDISTCQLKLLHGAVFNCITVSLKIEYCYFLEKKTLPWKMSILASVKKPNVVW